MKKFILLLASFLIAAYVFIGCVSAPKTETSAEEQKEEKKSDKKVVEPILQPEPEPEPELPKDPPNVIFAKALQQELANRNIKGAISLFEQLPEELESDLGLKMVLASLYYSDLQFDNAQIEANKILEVEPSNIDALELISLCNHAKGDKAAYNETSKKILEVDPYNASANIQRAQDYAIVKKYKQARDCYKQALKGDPKNPDALFGYAQMSYYMDDIKTATTTFQKILDIDENNPSALSYMGKIQAENENYLRASKYVKQAIENDPYNYDYWIDYGTYLRYQGKYDDAIESWQHAASLDPTYFLAYVYLAGCYDERNMYQDALDNYRMVIKTNPNYYFAYEEAALLEYHLGNYENAIKYFNKAYEYSESVNYGKSTNSYCYKLMSYACYTKLGNSYKAKEELAPVLKKLDKSSIEYTMVRFFNDAYSKNAESSLIGKISKEENSTKRGKMLFYMGLYCELTGADTMASEYYAKVTAMQAPMFFEYRIAEWSLGL